MGINFKEMKRKSLITILIIILGNYYYVNAQNSKLIGTWKLVDYTDDIERTKEEKKIMETNLSELKKNGLIVFSDDFSFERYGFANETEKGEWSLINNSILELTSSESKITDTLDIEFKGDSIFIMRVIETQGSKTFNLNLKWKKIKVSDNTFDLVYGIWILKEYESERTRSRKDKKLYRKFKRRVENTAKMTFFENKTFEFAMFYEAPIAGYFNFNPDFSQLVLDLFYEGQQKYDFKWINDETFILNKKSYDKNKRPYFVKMIFKKQ